MTLRFVAILLILPFLFGCDGDNVTEPPEPTPIRITSPSNNSTLEDPVTVIATAGSGYSFTRVDFYIDGDSVWSDTTSPYQYYWDICVYSGSSPHFITAVGQTADTSYTSDSVSVNVVIVPVRITSPSNGTTLNNPVTVVATPSSCYSFSRVDFYIDGDSVWSDNTAPYQYYWNIFIYSGTSEHTIGAVGYAADTSYASTSITVSVVIIQGFSFLSAYVPNSLVAHGVTSYENVMMFVATGDPGVEVIDISSKSSPQYLSRYDSFGLAMKVDVSYPYVYIADRDEGALQVDFSDVGSLILTGIYNTPGLANDVAVSDNYLYVADQDGLAIADISIPDTLIALNRQELPTAVNYVVVRGDTAFATNLEGLYIIDFTNPYFPDILGGAPYITQGQAQAVAVTDTFAFIADGFEGVIALSINDPSNPRFLARYAVEQVVSTVDTGDSTLFIGAFSGGVYALDYSQPDTLRLIDQFESNNLVWQVHSNPPYLYAATSGGVSILRFVR